MLATRHVSAKKTFVDVQEAVGAGSAPGHAIPVATMVEHGRQNLIKPNNGRWRGGRRAVRQKPVTPPLRIPVPLGTVVKRRRGGALLGELLRPGQTLVVARGGSSGAGVVAPAKRGAARQSSRRRQVSGLFLCAQVLCIHVLFDAHGNFTLPWAFMALEADVQLSFHQVHG